MGKPIQLFGADDSTILADAGRALFKDGAASLGSTAPALDADLAEYHRPT